MSNFAVMKTVRAIVFALTVTLLGVSAVWACTSAIIGAGASSTGRMLLWKHRDTGVAHSFVAHVAAADSIGGLEYVALFNGGDSLLREAWVGVNEAGFGVMNTASYNLVPDTARVRDREGEVMTMALARCRSVADFDSLLRVLPRPMGVQANFGCGDASGSGAWFETCDTGFVRFDIARPDTMMVRTNYSHSGNEGGGYGYIREASAVALLSPMVDRRDIAPQAIFDSVSCSFYHSLVGYDMLSEIDSAAVWLVDQDFIPRYSTGASIVIELPGPGDDIRSGSMWTALGYPPASRLVKATLDSIPEILLPNKPEWRAPLSEEAYRRKQEIFPIEHGSGPHYIYLPALRKSLK